MSDDAIVVQPSEKPKWPVLSKMLGQGLARQVTSRISDTQINLAIAKIYSLKLGGAGMAYFLQLAVAFYLGAANYGVFALSWIIATALGQICCCGFNDTTSRFLPAYLTLKDLPRARGFVQFSSRFAVRVSSIVALGAALLLVLAREQIPDIYFTPVFISLLCIPVLTFTHLKESIAISRSHVIVGLLPTYILRPLFLIVFTAAVAIVLHNYTAKVGVIGLFLGSIAVAFIQTRLLSKPMAAELGEGEIKIERAHWLSASLPLFLAQGFFVLTTSVDVMVLSFFFQPEILGIYFAGAKMVALLSFIQVAVGTGMMRRFSEALAQDDRKSFQAHFRRGRILMFGPTLLGAGLLILCAPFLLGMFGPDFVVGSSIVTILTIGVLIQAAGGPIQEALIVSGNQKAVSAIIGGFFVVNVIMSIAMANSLGMIGVAVASAFTVSTRIVAMYLFARFRGSVPIV